MKNQLSPSQIIGLALLIFAAFWDCSEKSTSPDRKPGPEFELGKNRYTLEIDGDKREYFVHVPMGYDANNATPVVFMLHGASGRGEWMYKFSGWKELGEEENILTVFPTAWSYCWIKANDVVRDTTRWNSFPGIFTFCAGEKPRDDVKFLRHIVDDLKQKFTVDSQRIYMVGFSSGGQMAFRCAVEMSDVIAAVVQSGGTHQIDTVFTPVRNLPITFELGNKDETWFQDGAEAPLSIFDDVLKNHYLFKRIVNVHINSFYCESIYQMSGDTTSALTATYKGIPNIGNRVFNFTLIDGLDHSYPNTVNHPMNGARQNWDWLQQYFLR